MSESFTEGYYTYNEQRLYVTGDIFYQGDDGKRVLITSDARRVFDELAARRMMEFPQTDDVGAFHTNLIADFPGELKGARLAARLGFVAGGGKFVAVPLHGYKLKDLKSYAKEGGSWDHAEKYLFDYIMENKEQLMKDCKAVGNKEQPVKDREDLEIKCVVLFVDISSGPCGYRRAKNCENLFKQRRIGEIFDCEQSFAYVRFHKPYVNGDYSTSDRLLRAPCEKTDYLNINLGRGGFHLFLYLVVTDERPWCDDKGHKSDKGCKTCSAALKERTAGFQDPIIFRYKLGCISLLGETSQRTVEKGTESASGQVTSSSTTMTGRSGAKTQPRASTSIIDNDGNEAAKFKSSDQLATFGQDNIVQSMAGLTVASGGNTASSTATPPSSSPTSSTGGKAVAKTPPRTSTVRVPEDLVEDDDEE